jgi:hypothetical protein
MKTDVGEEALFHVFLTSAQDKIILSASRSDHLTPEEEPPSVHWTEGYVGTRANMDAMKTEESFCLSGNPTIIARPALRIATISTELSNLRSYRKFL